jgi:hypothetical protein
MIEQRANDMLIPDSRMPAADDINEAASCVVIPGDGLPPHDATGDGGHDRADTHKAGASIPTPTIECGAGQCTRDIHTAAAGSEDVEDAGLGHRRSDAHAVTADLALLHSLLGHFARQLWDVQAARIAAGNRVAAMERGGLADYAEPARHVVREYESIERGIDRELTKLVRRHFMAPWIAEQRGIGLPGFARILGVTGPLDRFATVSKLWKYLGLHVTDGHAPRREKGVPWTHSNCTFSHLRTCKPDCTTDHHPNCTEDGVGTAYAPQGRVVCRQLGESIVKVGGPYRALYDAKRAEYLARERTGPSECVNGQTHRSKTGKVIRCVKQGDEGETSAHVYSMAVRYAVKCLIRDMWIEWRLRRPAEE